MLKKLRRSKVKGIKKELRMSLYWKLKKVIRIKNKLKKKVYDEVELKAIETEKNQNQNQKDQERAEDESLFKAKEADQKQKQRDQEWTKEEYFFKVKEHEQKQEQTEKRKYMMKLNWKQKKKRKRKRKTKGIKN